MAGFTGLAHRLQPVTGHGPVTFVNDSKATNGVAAACALAAYDSIYWIAGGEAKEDGLGPAAAATANVERAYLIGSAAPDFAKTLRTASVPIMLAGDLATATAAAFSGRRRRDACRWQRDDPAVAGRRLLRPVRQLRCPRRCLLRHRAPGGLRRTSPGHGGRRACLTAPTVPLSASGGGPSTAGFCQRAAADGCRGAAGDGGRAGGGERINLPSQHFGMRQGIFHDPGVGIMLVVSLLEPRPIRALALLGLPAPSR